MKAVHFVSGGSEGNDTAMKLALSYHLTNGEPRRQRFIARWASYHGATLGATSLSGHTGRRRIYHRALMDVDIDCARALDTAIRREGPENVAAFFVEPIVGSTLGAVVPVDGYFPLIREICDEHGVLLVADEVMTGFGRTGRNFGLDHWGVTPDIIVTGKGISSGYAPLGAIIIGERIVDLFEGTGSDFPHIFTFAFNPLSSAAGSTALKILVREKLIQRSAEMGEYLGRRLREMVELPLIGDVRGRGLLHGVEFVKDKATKEPYPPEKRVSSRIFTEMASRGVLPYIGTGSVDGTRGDHFTLCPPFVITEEQIDAIIQSIEEAVKSVERTL
jgi:adenosylmethionine-8-amino-7-oxononanoate aminotransferase